MKQLLYGTIENKQIDLIKKSLSSELLDSQHKKAELTLDKRFSTGIAPALKYAKTMPITNASGKPVPSKWQELREKY